MTQFLRTRKKSIRAVLLATVISIFSFKQSSARTLNSGDLAVIGINALTDEMRFVALVNIPAGTVIKITDKGWDTDLGMFTGTSTGDGVITWTVALPIPQGTVLRLVLGGSDNIPTTGLFNLTANTNLTANAVFSTYTVTDAITLVGDQFFIYQDADTNPYFITGNNSGRTNNMDPTNWQFIITSTLVESTLPDGFGSQNSLINGTNAIGLRIGGVQLDNVQYNGSTTPTNRAGWLSRLVNAANWGGDNTGTLTGTIGTTAGTIISLPVKLSSFSANLEDVNSVSIYWNLAQTEEGAVYEVQRSSDTKNFVTINTQQGIAYKMQFNYHDQLPSSGTYYYRLKIKDIDGSILYSNIAIVKAGSKEKMVSVYPNPVSKGGSIQISLQNQIVDKIEIVNPVGQVVYAQSSKITGSSTITLPSTITKGQYFVRLLNGTEMIAVKKLEIR